MANRVKLYTDGSWSSNNKGVSGWSYIAVVGDKVMHYDNGQAPGTSQQIGGELKAVMAGLLWCYKNGIKEVDIYYDYTGIKHWALGEWKAKKDLPKKYQGFVSPLLTVMDIQFVKVAAHTGDELNELADQLAKKAIGL